MTTARISDKGQITLPARIRRQLGLEPSTLVEVEVQGDGVVIRPLRSAADMAGYLAPYVKGGYVDWETARSETERIVARQVALEGLEDADDE